MRLFIVAVCAYTVYPAFIVKNLTHFLDDSFEHVNGSACCALETDPIPLNSSDACAARCSQRTPICETFVFQPSTGICWLGKGRGTGLVPIPGADRIAGFLTQTNIATSICKNRGKIPQILNSTLLVGIGVILGVGHGQFAKHLLNEWQGGLYLVDPYIHIWKGYDDPANYDDKSHQAIYENLHFQLLQYEGRHAFIRDFACSFAETWVSNSLGGPVFVYVDNNPAADSVMKDIESWWPILAPGGVMAGNRYDLSTVKQSVTSFFASRSITVFTTGDSDHHPNWIVFKPHT